MNCTGGRSLLLVLLIAIACTSVAQHQEGRQAIPSGESTSIMQLAMNCSDTTALRLLQEARERRFREACGHVPTHGCRHGLYLRANDKSPTQRGNAPMTYAEMIPMLEEGLRIARELAGREADERTNNPKP